MQIRLSIQCSKKPGILARAITSLRRFGFNVVQQNSVDQGDEILIQLVVEGTAAGGADIVEIVGKLDGVYSVKTHVPEVPKGPSDSNQDALEHSDEPAAKIARAYPNIYEMVEAQKSEYSKKELAEKMRELGIGTSSLRGNGRRLPTITPGANLTEIITSQLIPDLLPIAQAELGEGGLKILSSVFTDTKTQNKKGLGSIGFSLSAFDVNVDRCDFLCGYIQGVVNQANWLKRIHVSETYCRKEGQPFCLFEFR